MRTPNDGEPSGDESTEPGASSIAARLIAPVHEGFLSISVVDTVALGVSIAAMVYLNQRTSPNHLPLLVPSLASSALLLFSLPGLDIARSWNVIAGQFLGALAGFICVTLLGNHPAVVAGCAVALALVLMRIAHAIHPPGAATALIVVIVPADQAARFMVFPVLAGAVLITAFAWLVHVGERHVTARIRPNEATTPD